MVGFWKHFELIVPLFFVLNKCMYIYKIKNCVISDAFYLYKVMKINQELRSLRVKKKLANFEIIPSPPPACSISGFSETYTFSFYPLSISRLFSLFFYSSYPSSCYCYYCLFYYYYEWINNLMLLFSSFKLATSSSN